MLDHIFSDSVGSFRDALESVHLERTVVDERFQTDMVLGDLTWSTSYALPGEQVPAKVRADITLLWPTESQTAYRRWVNGDDTAQHPIIDVEIAYRVQGLRTPPSVEALLQPLNQKGPAAGADALRRDDATVETVYGDETTVVYAFEVAYSGEASLDGKALGDGPTLDALWQPIGSWVSATLVGLGERSEAFR